MSNWSSASAVASQRAVPCVLVLCIILCILWWNETINSSPCCPSIIPLIAPGVALQFGTSNLKLVKPWVMPAAWRYKNYRSFCTNFIPTQLPRYFGGKNGLILEWLEIGGLHCRYNVDWGDAHFRQLSWGHDSTTALRDEVMTMRPLLRTWQAGPGPSNSIFNIWKLNPSFDSIWNAVH